MTGPAQTPTLDRPATRDALATIVGFRLRRLQNLWIAHWAHGIRRMGLAITPMQGGTLMLINENPGIGHSTLAGLLQIEAPTLSQSLAPLVESGLVLRVRTKGDGRAVALRLTPSGMPAVAGITDFCRVHEAVLLAGLDLGEQREFTRLLDKALASAVETVSGKTGSRAGTR